MKIILEQRVEKLGLPGDIVEVADGYARNYLIPKKLASVATKHNIERLKKKVEKLRELYTKELNEAKKIAEKLESFELKLQMTAGEEGKLFGSVTSQTIADELNAKGITVDKKKILLDEHIKQVGEYKVNVKIHPEITATLKIIIEKKEKED